MRARVVAVLQSVIAHAEALSRASITRIWYDKRLWLFVLSEKTDDTPFAKNSATGFHNAFRCYCNHARISCGAPFEGDQSVRLDVWMMVEFFDVE